MNDKTTTLMLSELERALERLREAVEQPPENPLAIDGTIQRFEFSIELFWRALKKLLAEQGVQTTTPRETLRAAFKAFWIKDDALWLAMLDDRNRTSHTYKRELAETIYANIGIYLPELERTYRELVARMG